MWSAGEPLNMGCEMTNCWTDDRVATLKKLWTEGLSASQIAKQLGGVTRNAVIGKVHRLGLAGRAAPSRPIKRVSVPVARIRPSIAPVSVDAAAEIAKAVRLKKASAALVGNEPANPSAETPAKPIAAKVRPLREGEIIGVLELGPNMCKWPIGDPGDPDFGFCGTHCASGAVYCEEHAAIAFQPAMPRRPGVTRDDKIASEARRLARLANF
jgi:GcrA cell cycle regulator